jgi:hypothetical protein
VTENEKKVLQEAHFYGTLKESHGDPRGAAPGETSAAACPAVNAHCDHPSQHGRAWLYWTPTGALVCHECFPLDFEEPRWLITGGPTGELPDLTAIGSVFVYGRDYDPPSQNDEEAPTEPAAKRKRWEPLDGQLDVFS